MKKMELEEVKAMLENEKESEEMIDWYLKTYTYYKTNDNLVLSFKNKPSITKTLYFDDEYEIPELTENLFLNYNEMNYISEYRKIEKYNKQTQPYFVKHYCTSDIQVSVISFGDYYSDYLDNLNYNNKKNYFKRYLTDEEIQEYNEICDEFINNYIERLKKYFKKYNKNIYCMGYWANR